MRKYKSGIACKMADGGGVNNAVNKATSGRITSDADRNILIAKKLYLDNPSEENHDAFVKAHRDKALGTSSGNLASFAGGGSVLGDSESGGRQTSKRASSVASNQDPHILLSPAERKYLEQFGTDSQARNQATMNLVGYSPKNPGARLNTQDWHEDQQAYLNAVNNFNTSYHPQKNRFDGGAGNDAIDAFKQRELNKSMKNSNIPDPNGKLNTFSEEAKAKENSMMATDALKTTKTTALNPSLTNTGFDVDKKFAALNGFKKGGLVTKVFDKKSSAKKLFPGGSVDDEDPKLTATLKTLPQDTSAVGASSVKTKPASSGIAGTVIQGATTAYDIENTISNQVSDKAKNHISGDINSVDTNPYQKGVGAKNAMKWGASGAVVGSAFGPIGTVVGGIIGAGAGLASGIINNDRKKQFNTLEDNKHRTAVYQNDFDKMAKGGKIEGPGTGTSDSIDGHLPGGFVIPAKNAKTAEYLRAKYLGNSNQKADVKSGVGRKVKVSDGEHYFTDEEVNVLKGHGVDLDKLAPDAENKTNGFRYGGDPLAEAKRKAKAREEEKTKKANEERLNAAMQKEVNDHTYNLKFSQKDAVIAKQKLDKIVNDPNASSKDIEDAEANYKKANNAFSEGSKVLKAKQNPANYKANDFGNYNFQESSSKKTPEVSKEGIVNNPLTYKANEIVNPVNKTTIAKPVTKNAVPKKATVPVDKSIVQPSASLNPGKVDNTMGDQDETDPFDYRDNGRAGIANKVAQSSSSTGNAVKHEDVVTKTDKKGNPDKNGKTDVGIGEVLGGAQAAAGLAGLVMQKKRPVYQIGADTQQDLQQAKDNAQFGYSASELEAAKTSIEGNRLASEKNIINLSNDAGTALANIRGSSINANHAMLELAAGDAELKRQKQMFKSGLVNQMENRRRQQFEDSMGRFQQNQTANANLLNAGIGNIVGSSERRSFNKSMADASNVTVNLGQ